MNGRSAEDSGFSRLDIARAVALMVAFVLFVGVALESRGRASAHPEPSPSGDGGGPIETEAGVFRLQAKDLAVAPDYVEDRGAHPRSLAIYRRLRAYPGAPPRIPHGLTDEEFRQGSCSACHEKGGWVARFGTFAPVTPHPEYGACLQCHMPRDELVGLPLPEPGAPLVCGQCHVDPDAPPRLFSESDWIGAPWPQTDIQAMEGSPHAIPHAIRGRSNCLACHAGPAAIAALRVDHPEHSNCRQCHVSLADEDGWAAGEGIGEAWYPGGEGS
ncbi:MAG: hypothetical protein R3304_03575 [Longimicrobiales bacterium]|nr:hypothetical protein [Longimicrobiales bacterium]